MKLNISGTLGSERPFGRVWGSMSNFGGANRVILFGGHTSEMKYLEDAWMFTFDSGSQQKYCWIRLEASYSTTDRGNGFAPHPRIHTSFLSVADSLLMFGGKIRHDDGPSYETRTAGDSWYMGEGCPPGTYYRDTKGCSDCPVGKYNDNSDSTPCNACPVSSSQGIILFLLSSFPSFLWLTKFVLFLFRIVFVLRFLFEQVGTTTTKIRAKNKLDCSSCYYNSSLQYYGHCNVENFMPVWSCYPGQGYYGPECGQQGCGAGDNGVCDGHGTCDDGVNGTGNCTCSTHTYGTYCEKPCPGYGDGTTGTGAEDRVCGGHGTCNYVDGTVICECELSYLGSTDCTVPWFLIVLLIVSAMVLVVLAIFFYRWQKQLLRDKDLALSLRESQLEAQHRNALSNMEEGWIVQWADLTLKKLIARGAYGEVWRAKWALMPAIKYVAVKKIRATPSLMIGAGSNDNGQDNNDIHAIFRDQEIRLLMRIRHTRICFFLGAGRTDGGEIFLVTEYVPGGNLREVLDDLTIFLTTSRCLNIAKDIAEGMAHLHGRHLIHRDLKSLNVLIDGSGRAKIADFGLSRFTTAKERKQRVSMKSSIANVDNKELRTTLNKDEKDQVRDSDAEEKSTLSETKTSSKEQRSLRNLAGLRRTKGASSTSESDSEYSTEDGSASRRRSSRHRPESAEMTGNRGSVLWMAPEILSQTGETAQYGFSADVYSFGIVLYEIITRRVPWSEVRPPMLVGVLHKLEAGIRPSLTTNKERSNPLVALMNICWSQDPDDRPSFSECLTAISVLVTPTEGDRRRRMSKQLTIDSESTEISTTQIRFADNFADNGSRIQSIENPMTSNQRVEMSVAARQTRQTVAGNSSNMMSVAEMSSRTDSLTKKKSKTIL